MFRKWISRPRTPGTGSPFLRRSGDAVDELAVDGELDHAVDGDHVVGVPLALALAAVLDRLAALAARVVGRGLHAADAEQLAVDVRDGGVTPSSLFRLGHSSSSIWTSTPLGSRLSDRHPSLQTNTPELPPASMCIHSMCRMKFSYCFSVRIRQSDGPSRRAAVPRVPRVGRRVHVDPAREVLAVEQVFEARDVLGGHLHRATTTAVPRRMCFIRALVCPADVFFANRSGTRLPAD